MSIFDPNSLLNTTFNEANDTRLIQVPVGEYNALVKDVKIRSGTIKRGDRQGEPFYACDVTWEIDSQVAREATGLPHPTVRQGIMLDVLSGGGLDFGKGKNVGLGKLRAALGKNEPGQPWSFDGFKGLIAKVNVVARPADDGSGDVYADIKGVAPIG